VYGEELRALLAFYPDAEVSDEQVIVQCEHCYRYEGRPLLAAYIFGRFSSDYNHRCRCGHRVWPLYEDKWFAGVPCPRCSGTMKAKRIGLWD